jgi:hypothetical protein
MTQRRKFRTATAALALCGAVWLMSPTPTQAATITDTFQVLGVDREWCRGNPKFVETHRAQALDAVTMTITQDPLNTGDVTSIQATIFTVGGSPEIDAMTLNGLVFPSNKFGSIAQFVLMGTLNNGHFLTIRGQATVDKGGHLTKVTATAWDQITDTYSLDKHGNKSGPVDCFETVTLVMKQKPSSSSGSGTLSVSGAPSDVGATFVAAPRSVSQQVVGRIGVVAWGEAVDATFHEELVIVGLGAQNGNLIALLFVSLSPSGETVWACSSGCSSFTMIPSTGTLILSNTILTDSTNSHPPITLNGTLTFTPTPWR